MEPLSGQRNPEISAEPALDIQIIPEDPEEIAAREGIHERIQAEIHQENKEVEARAEEMLEVPPEWNKAPDLMMEEKDVLPKATGSNKKRRDESPKGGENEGKKTISGRRNKDTHLQYPGGYKIQRDSIPKIGTKTSRRKTIGKHQISGRKSHRWCFATKSLRFIR